MIRRQSNNQWSGGIAAHPTPKVPTAQIRWKSSHLDFFGIKSVSSPLIIFQKPNYQRGVLRVSAGAIEGYFEGKNATVSSPRWSCSCRKMSRLTRHL